MTALFSPSSQMVTKRRSRRRNAEGGAIVFIVAMTLAVLASLGLYALGQTSNDMKTAGYARQSAQTHYLSEYGVLGGAQTMTPQTSQLYLGLMRNSTRRDTSCISLPTPANPSGLPAQTQTQCRRMGAAELGTMWTGALANGGLSTTSYNSFGPYPVTGDFFIELTDPVQTQPPTGFDLKLGLCFAQFTLSSVGLVQPNVANTADQTYFGNQGLEMARARITAGPIRCQQ
jgi:hypothetical protein